MAKTMISNLCIDIIKENLPTLAKDISENYIKKYTKDGIFKPNEEDIKCIKQMKNQGLNVLAIIDGDMFYNDKKLEIINYIYTSKHHTPTISIKGIKIEALVKNKTWKIEDDGLININEINGNLIRVF